MPGLFLSYRRDDVAGQVGRLFERLSSHYGDDFVFMDVESITPGLEFERVITGRIRNCDVVLLAIGPRWPTDRLHDADDLVRLELAEALDAKRTLLPLLIDRPSLPKADELPTELRAVLDLQAGTVRHSTFDRDVDQLLRDLELLGVRPTRSHRRHRAEEALAAAGSAYALLGAISRWCGPLGSAALVMLVLAAAGWGLFRLAHRRGLETGSAQQREAAAQEVERVTLDYERASEEERRESLRIDGLITDGRQGVESAQVELTNMANNMTVAVETDSRGVYVVDLARVAISEGDVVRLVVTKSPYRKTIENVKYHQGFREFRAVLRR